MCSSFCCGSGYFGKPKHATGEELFIEPPPPRGVSSFSARGPRVAAVLRKPPRSLQKRVEPFGGRPSSRGRGQPFSRSVQKRLALGGAALGGAGAGPGPPLELIGYLPRVEYEMNNYREKKPSPQEAGLN